MGSSLSSASSSSSRPPANSVPSSNEQKQSKLPQLVIKGMLSSASHASKSTASQPSSLAFLASQSVPVSKLLTLGSKSAAVSSASMASLMCVKKSSRSVTTHDSSYKIHELDRKFVSLLDSAIDIVHIVKLERKLPSGLPHHEILIQTLYTQYVISFHKDGIDTLLVGGLQQYCKESKCQIVEQQKGNFPIKRVKKFMKDHEKVMYDLLTWNCLLYADQLYTEVTM